MREPGFPAIYLSGFEAHIVIIIQGVQAARFPEPAGGADAIERLEQLGMKLIEWDTKGIGTGRLVIPAGDL